MKSSKSFFVAVLSGWCALVRPELAAAPSGPPLATGLHKYLGGIDSSLQRVNFTSYFDQVTPENAGKWGSVEGTRDVMNWTELDTAYALAKTNGFPFKMHNLIWGAQQPAWISSLPAADQLAQIKEWFAAVAARYPDIDMIDVVNEPINTPPDGINGHANYLNALGGTGASGWDWVLEAFRLARTYFPHSKLLVNEYNVTSSANAAQRYVGLIQLLQADKLIDGIGIQEHAFETVYYPASSISANLNTVAATGLPIFISEFDIDGADADGTVDDAKQLAEYQRVFPIFWDNAAVRGVTLWGYRRGLWRDAEGAYLVRDDGTERPALTWLRSYVLGDRAAAAVLPRTQSAGWGGSVTLTAAVSGDPAPTLQWADNGGALAGATSATLALANLRPADTGLYEAEVTNGTTTATSVPVIVGLDLPPPRPTDGMASVVGDGTVVGVGIRHPNGNGYDQVLLTGPAATVNAYSSRVTRTSFIDMNGDIVQVEFSGAGSLSLVLDGAESPAPPENYNQPSVSYVKGHVGLVIAGADETTNVLVFTVGRATAFDPTGHYNILLAPSATNDPAKNGSSLFTGHETTAYDGVADVAFIAIASTDGKFGGLRASDARCWATAGYTGVYAPGVAFVGPVYLGDIDARDNATPVIVVGSTDDARITGGDLQQTNGAHVLVHGLKQLKFTGGGDSGGNVMPAQMNQAVLEEDGADVTSQIVVNP
ncbi:MAG TPA: endo-1,4-beta-xylanase [Opitutus sp.]|nr:endo-1,4-beta-xylanase [Opitutus sp.]